MTLKRLTEVKAQYSNFCARLKRIDFLSEPNKNTARHFIAVFAVITIGTFGYYFIESNWTLFDALYMTFITITTVGYGETHELSIAGRTFTMFLIILGFGTFASTATYLVKFLIQNELSGVMRRKKMISQIQKMSNHYIICGLDSIGIAIAVRLYDSKVPFVIVEIDNDSTEIARQRGYPCVTGNNYSDELLVDAGIEHASGIIVCTANESDNLLITLAARELKPTIYCIVRSDDPQMEQRIIRAGANRVVYPMQLGGEQIANLVSRKAGHESKSELNYATSEDLLGFSLQKYTLYDFDQRTVEELLHKTGSGACVALEKENGTIVEHPDTSHIVLKGDTLLLLRKYGQIGSGLLQDHGEVITWKDSLSVGISSIDLEHKQLIKLTNDLGVAILEGEIQDSLKHIMDKLLEYTTTHFRNEEALLEKYKYPEREKHIEEHNKLTIQVMDLHREFHFRYAENIVEFLRVWLSNHIIHSDMEFGEYLKNRGIK